MRDPQQEIFTALRQALISELGGNVYDGALPPEGTPYPFVYLGDNQMMDAQNKTCIFGMVVQTIHVYSDSPRKRGSISQMLLLIKQIVRSIETTENYAWDVVKLEQRILPDDSTDVSLIHGIITVTFRFT